MSERAEVSFDAALMMALRADRATRYLISFLGVFIFVGCVTVGTVFADLCNKKETARKNLTVSR